MWLLKIFLKSLFCELQLNISFLPGLISVDKLDFLFKIECIV